MSRYLEGRRYGFLTPENSGDFYKGIQHQQVAGYPVGIVYIEQVNYPLLPGNVVNACTYDFPVRMKAVPNLTNDRLSTTIPRLWMTLSKQPALWWRMTACGQCAAPAAFLGTTSSRCGGPWMCRWPCPVWCRSPGLSRLIRPDQRIGILTANKGSMTKELLASCGVEHPDRLVSRMLLGDRGVCGGW